MTTDHKRVVLEKYPEATMKIWPGSSRRYLYASERLGKCIGDGITENKAWKDAAQRLQEAGK